MKYFLFLCTLASFGAYATDHAHERQVFQRLYSAAARGDALPDTQLASLRDYPLYPYLEYPPLLAKLPSLPVSDLKKFFARYPDSLLAARLRTEWLRELARHGQWNQFAADYAPQADPELQCDALAIPLRGGETPTPERMEPVLAAWETGKPLPAPCEPVFAQLHSLGLLNNIKVWERLLRAAQLGNLALAQDIAKRYAPVDDQTWALRLVRALSLPSKVLSQPGLAVDSKRARIIVASAIARFANIDLTHAIQTWQIARQRYHFSVHEAGLAQRALAVAAVVREDKRRLDLLAAVPTPRIDDQIEALRLREGLRARNWQKIVNWTDGKPRGALTDRLRWQYWHARALDELGQHTAAHKLFERLADERDYYGFLASDKLKVAYTINHQAVAPAHTELASIAAIPGIKRAHELYQLGMRGLAIEEWNFTLKNRTKRELEVAAKLAFDWGWYDRAIAMLGQIPSYEDLDLRFPILHRELVEHYAKQRALPTALVYAIIRCESAFAADARSGSGALGLMQLMPMTGELTAKSLGIELVTAENLTDPDKNIAIGSEYLRQVMRQFGNSFPLAAAAYNAGPGRVRQWLASSGCTPPDLWVELIPFAETEGYVRRALYYAAIYEWRLGQTISTLAVRMDGVNTRASNGEC